MIISFEHDVPAYEVMIQGRSGMSCEMFKFAAGDIRNAVSFSRCGKVLQILDEQLLSGTLITAFAQQQADSCAGKQG